MPAQGCGNPACSNCKELDDFLLSGDRTSIRFEVSDDLGYHLETTSRWDSLEWNRNWTERAGNITPLTLKKVKTIFQRDVDLFEAQMKALEQLVNPLKGEFMEKLLGKDGYRELVLLAGIRLVPDHAGGKKPAEEESDNNSYWEPSA